MHSYIYHCVRGIYIYISLVEATAKQNDPWRARASSSFDRYLPGIMRAAMIMFVLVRAAHSKVIIYLPKPSSSPSPGALRLIAAPAHHHSLHYICINMAGGDADNRSSRASTAIHLPYIQKRTTLCREWFNKNMMLPATSAPARLELSAREPPGSVSVFIYFTRLYPKQLEVVWRRGGGGGRREAHIDPKPII